MSLLTRIRSFWRNLFHRAEAEKALEEELRAYVAELAGEYRRGGMSEDEARRAALLEVRGVEQVKESVRAAWMGQWIHDVSRDVRYSARALRNRPGFAVVAVVTLALGLGGATAVFSIVDGVIFRPPPGITEPDRLVGIDRVVDGVAWDGLSYPELQDLRTNGHVFSAVAAHVATVLPLSEADGSRRNVVVDFASRDYFPLLETAPALGRLLAADDADPGDLTPAAVLAYDFWQSRFGGDPGVLGRTLTLAGSAFTVVGVAARGLNGTTTGQHADVWAPLPMVIATGYVTSDFTADTRAHFLSALGRLSPGATLARARQEMATRGMAVRRGFGRAPQMRRRDDRFFVLLASAVTLLLLLACANVAALFLLRAASRRHELAARLTLGASRPALARQLLIEGALIAGGGAVLGGGAADLVISRSSVIPLRYGHIAFGLDPRVLAFALALATVTVALVSLFPILGLGRVAPMSVLRSATAGSGRRVSTAQRGLVVFQVAVSLTLVATASMIVTTLRRIVNANPGFDPRGVVMAYLEPRQAGYDTPGAHRMIRRLDAVANADPEIASATLATGAPTLGRGGETVFRDGEAPMGPAPTDTDAGTSVDDSPPRGLETGFAAVEPSYFTMLHIPLRSGRAFTDGDVTDAPHVAIVSRTLARRLWGSEDAVGRYLQLARHNAPPDRLLVVGIAADVTNSTLGSRKDPVLYVPIFQQAADGTLLIVRGRTGTPSRSTLRRLVAEVDPSLYTDEVWTTGDLMENWVRTQRVASAWIGVAGFLAVLLSALGVYGTVGYGVRERMRELAVRSAMGAEPWRLTALVMREGMLLSAAGAMFGALLLLGTQTIVRRSLEGMAGVDFGVVAGCAAVLGVAMAISSYLPARRLRRISPVQVLRQE